MFDARTNDFIRLKKTIFQPYFLSTQVLKNTQKLGFSLPL